MSEPVNSGSAQRHQSLAENLMREFADRGCVVKYELGEVTIEIPAACLIEVATRLRDEADFRFEVLIDACGVDYSEYGRSEWTTGEASFTGFGRGVESTGAHGPENDRRFAVVYHLLSISLNMRMRMRVYVDSSQPIVESVTQVWASAEWYEREAFDLYGILFGGHQDLRRILTDYGFVGHPFRKDFPLEGHVEMRYDSEKSRVVYEPVSILPRTLVPKVIRTDNRYLDNANQQQDPADA
ncbi:MAG: NADH-quinone oxidoreductase subunit C [Gammaproteobacteria bacterium]|nr:NADH-quinone oxidoreductase subunit C [Gammaproteobacteria bacterium]MCP5441726.1 NADH-quinone oxidoreductase subunit C [Chromatiaceae bacterium]